MLKVRHGKTALDIANEEIKQIIENKIQYRKTVQESKTEEKIIEDSSQANLGTKHKEQVKDIEKISQQFKMNDALNEVLNNAGIRRSSSFIDVVSKDKTSKTINAPSFVEKVKKDKSEGRNRGNSI
jgi:3-deoxy-D-arabino-heptulosonate 7-phosphate (DAHP) synthase